MRYWVGFDVGKASHWLCVLDEEGEMILSERVGATEKEIEAALSKIVGLGGDRLGRDRPIGRAGDASGGGIARAGRASSLCARQNRRPCP